MLYTDKNTEYRNNATMVHVVYTSESNANRWVLYQWVVWYALVGILMLLTADFQMSLTLNNQKTHCNQNWQWVKQSPVTDHHQHKSLPVSACAGSGSHQVTILSVLLLLFHRWRCSTRHKDKRVHIIIGLLKNSVFLMAQSVHTLTHLLLCLVWWHQIILARWGRHLKKKCQLP